MITLFTICYNEEVILPFFIKWYRDRFKDCKIVVYDNYSTDNTEKIALENNCEVIKYDSNGEIRDDLYLEIKNNCWKQAETDWVMIVDADEMLCIDENQLKNEQEIGTTIITFEGWNLITMSNDPDIIDLDLKVGSRAKQYDKYYLFNRTKIQEINYTAGCHWCNPIGKKVMSINTYLMCHFKALGLNYMVNRYKEFATRMSQQNLSKGWGVHYLDSSDTIRNNWEFYQTHPENKKVL
jgi:glycosyltransferase involved in cell wall biosynthesis